MKELPKMYQNKITKEINNTQKIYSSLEDKNNNIKTNNIFIKKPTINNRYNIEQKIYNIFNSPDYIYKVDVTIVTNNGTIEKRIVGKNRTNLITIDNEYIPISSIIDIYKNN